MSAVRRALERIFLKLLPALFHRKVLNKDDLDRTEIKHILLIGSEDGTAQPLLTIPAIRAIRQTFPNAHIAFLAPASNEIVLRHSIYLDEHIPFYGLTQLWPVRLLRLFSALRRGYDLTVVFSMASSSLLYEALACLSRTKYILGSEKSLLYENESRSCYNFVAPVTDEEQHAIERRLNVVRYLNIDTANLREELNLTSSERIVALEFLRQHNTSSENLLIGLCIETIEDEWSYKSFIQFARHYSEKRNAKVVVFGRDEDSSFRNFWNGLPFAPISLSTLALRESLAVLTFCNFVVCNDSEIMHLVASVSIPSIILFGSADRPEQTKPIGPEFVALTGRDNKRSAIPVDLVIQTGETLLQKFPRTGERDARNFDINEKVLQEYLETFEAIDDG